ncbi:MAG: DNA primase [Yoonia sp.]|jgi:DNA primase
MSLPPGFIDELRTRLSIGQVVGRKVMWDTRKSNQGKGDLWAPCPFHQEKSASFHVDDQKGFYYCFGCHAKGDAISFVRETENVSFMEAVQILAGEAGMTMPASDPRAQEKAEQRTSLVDVMEQAVQWHRLQLQTAAAGEARDYLTRRGLSVEAQARWDIGFSPDRGGVLDHLTGKGTDKALVIEAGLAAESDRGGAPYDRFRGRIIFPIRDARGRAIGLGGRAMAADARAKYLNSPETPLFDKGRSLYNYGPAREAAGKGKPLIVAEGYMDVIALSEAGFTSCVAPLGTAITENQLRMMWRMSPEPIIALDGDTAGLRAAMRVIDIALPLLEAGQSVRFALMPEGMDPDDVIKQKGSGAMQALIDQAIPMVQLLWRRETEGKSYDSPERKAALDKTLREKIKLIQDPSIRSHYGEAIKELRWALFRPKKAQYVPGKRQAYGKADPWHSQMSPVASNKSSALGAGAAKMEHLLEGAILATLLVTPAAILPFESQIERMDCTDPVYAMLRAAILRHAEADDVRQAIFDDLGAAPLENLMSQPHVRIHPATKRVGDLEFASSCLSAEFDSLFTQKSYSRELRDGMNEMQGHVDEGLTWRLTQAAKSIDTSVRPDSDDTADFVKVENGSMLNKDERSVFGKLLENMQNARPGKGSGS